MPRTPLVEVHSDGVKLVFWKKRALVLVSSSLPRASPVSTVTMKAEMPHKSLKCFLD